MPSLPEGHKCRRPHGHSYVVEVTIETDHLDKYGFVVDYAVLDSFKTWIDDTVDHRDLNKVLDPKWGPTSAEVLATWFNYQVKDLVKAQLPIERYGRLKFTVVVKETESTFAEFSQW